LIKKSPRSHSPQVHACGECRVREEMIALLRAQITQLSDMNQNMQEKMLMMSGDAADRWHRLKMTEMAHLRPSASEGIVPRDELVMEEDRAVDALIKNLEGSFNQ